MIDDLLTWHDPRVELPELGTLVEAQINPTNPLRRKYLTFCIDKEEHESRKTHKWRVDRYSWYKTREIVAWRKVIP
jgi:hypothetical protein